MYDSTPWAVKLPMQPERVAFFGCCERYHLCHRRRLARRRRTWKHTIPRQIPGRQREDMLSPRRAAQAGVVNGIIYNIGGNRTSATVRHMIPSPIRGRQKQPMPGAGGDVAVTVYNGLVYTFGGGVEIRHMQTYTRMIRRQTPGHRSVICRLQGMPFRHTWLAERSMP